MELTRRQTLMQTFIQAITQASIFLTVFAIVVPATNALADTTVYVVRHAEKLDGDDPTLTHAGEQRANALARTLRSAQIAACYSSEFKRTRLTAEPTARRFQQTVKEHRAGKEKSLVEQVLRDHQGHNVLIVAHSTTVPAIVKHLGANVAGKIEEEDYDNLFIVRLSDSGAVKAAFRLHYGAANAAVDQAAAATPATTASGNP